MRIYRNPSEADRPAKRTTFVQTITAFIPSRSRKTRPSPQEDAPAGQWSVTRRAKVERARQLLKDPTYPPARVLRAVAEILRDQIRFWQLLPFLQL